MALWGGKKRGFFSSLFFFSSSCRETAIDLLNRELPSPLGTENYASLLRWCGHSKSLPRLCCLHAHLVRHGLLDGTRPFLSNLLVQMYGKNGATAAARATFERIRAKDIFSWNVVIAAHVQNGQPEEAALLFRRMMTKTRDKQEGGGVIEPDKYSFVSALSAFAAIGAVEDGKAIHDEIVNRSMQSDVGLMNALLNMYGKCGYPDLARATFDQMCNRDIISWNSMISVYARNNRGLDALSLFDTMDIPPDKITFLAALEACSNPNSLTRGQSLHKISTTLQLDSNIAVANSLITMYGRCGSVQDAHKIFSVAQSKNLVMWNAMIGAYAHSGNARDALGLFRLMDLEGIKPDKITFLNVLDACTTTSVHTPINALELGRAMHGCIVDKGFESDLSLMSSLLNLYGKCGSLVNARLVFDGMHRRNVITWTSMMAAYSRNGFSKEALDVFRRMVREGFVLDKIACVGILDACANLASLEVSKEIHDCISSSGFDSDSTVKNTLIHMYGKCGSLKDAMAIFGEMRRPTLVSWNAMIAAYAQYGHGKEVHALLLQMRLEGVEPDWITFVSVLKACSHTGLLTEGWGHLVWMRVGHGILPLGEHLVCMSDLVGRAGYPDQVEEFIDNMPSLPDVVAWTIFLNACRIHGDVERGERAAKQALLMDPDNSAIYALLSDIYATAGRWDDVAKVRKAMDDRGMKELVLRERPL